MKFTLRWLACFCLGCGFTVLAVAVFELSFMGSNLSQSAALPRTQPSVCKRPVYVVYAHRLESDYLRHVYETFQAFGFTRGDLDSTSTWDVMWAHDYPFGKLKSKLSRLAHHQKVNHFPGTGYITNKLDLAKTDSPFIPKAFEMPKQKEALLKFVAQYPEKMLVQKSNEHRGIRIEKFERMNLTRDGTFVQEFVHPPMLIDGHKFDIGVYTIITSVEPLRLYIYTGDILFRFCPVKYYPFDKENKDKYVVGDDYLPLWEVPSLRKYFNDGGYSMKETFNAYVRSTGGNVELMWAKLEEAIRSIVLLKEPSIVRLLKNYPSKRNFFEMVRFDFALDENMNVFVMEANMSPNLSSAHFPPNKLIYYQVLYNLFSLVGLGRYTRHFEENMEVGLKSLMVHPERCSSDMCASCFPSQCQLCAKCLSQDTVQYLKAAYVEHRNRQDCKRIFPPPVSDTKLANESSSSSSSSSSAANYSPDNLLLARWFEGKCEMDKDWC